MKAMTQDMKEIDVNKKTWQLIREMNADNLDAPAIELGCEKATYHEMFDMWDDNARIFSAMGITRENNSRVMVGLLNSIEIVNIIYALDMTGGIPFLFPEFFYLPSSVKRYIREHGITDIIILDFWYKSFRKIAKELKSEYGIRNIIVVNSPSSKKDMPFPLNIMTRFVGIHNRLNGRYDDYHDLIAKHRDATIVYDTAPATAISLVLSTSGSTTGNGRQVPFSDINRNAMARAIQQSDLKMYRRGIRIGLQLSLFSPYCTITALNTALVCGGSVVATPASLLKIVLNKRWVKNLMEKQPNVILGNTSLWKHIQNCREIADMDLSFLEYAISGGIYSSPEDLGELHDFLCQHGSPGVVVNGYGASEMGGVCMCLTDNFQRFDSMGRLLPGVQALIQDAEGKYHEPSDEPLEGELFICSDTISPDFPDREPTIETRNINGKRYYRTKDIVTYRPDGSFDFVTRVDFMFPIPAGIKIYPLKLEDSLKTDSRVENCGIVGRKIDDKTNAIRLYLVLGKDAEHNAATIESILMTMLNYEGGQSKRGFLLEEAPDEVVLVDRLPYGKAGKTDYKALRENPPHGTIFYVKKNFVNKTAKVSQKEL